MADDEVNGTLLRRSFRYLLETGAMIDLIGDSEVPEFKIEGQILSASQVILKAYAAGMVEAVLLT